MTVKRATLSHVAELSGVSAATVSKVLNARDDVSASTRARVQAVLDEVGYEAPGRRRSAARPARIVNFVCEQLTSDYAVEVLRGLVEYGAEVGVEIVVSQVRALTEDTEAWARRLAESERVGMVLVTSKMTGRGLRDFREHGVPVVVIDPFSPIEEGFVSVGATNWAGGRAATDHLLELGHRRIAYIGGPPSAECQVARYHGYVAALGARGIRVREEYVAGGSFQGSTGVEGLARVLEADERPTAVFAASDSIAVGIYEEASRRGIAIPEELSVIGFDGTALGERTLPPLTSVAQPLREMGQTALRLVLRQHEDGLIDSYQVELATSMIPRASTAPPAGA